MNAPSPIARAVLDIALLNPQGESVLRIGGGTQTLDLELANLTGHDVELGKGAQLRVTFRPGVLEKPADVTATGPGWSAEMEGARGFFQTLVITRTDATTLEPGALHTLVLGGLIPSGSGGSRATRVEVEYRDITLPGEGPVSGRRTLHLSVLHPEVRDATASGNQSEAGGITARLISSDEVVTGQDPATLEIAISADPAIIVTTAAGETGDDGPEIRVGFPTEGNTSLRFAGSIRGWTPGGTVLTYAGPKKKTLSGPFLTFKMSLATALKPGLYPLTLTLKNFDSTDRILTLLIRVCSVGRSDGMRVVKTSGPLTVSGGIDAHSIALDKDSPNGRTAVILFPGGWDFTVPTGNNQFMTRHRGKILTWITDDGNFSTSGGAWIGGKLNVTRGGAAISGKLDVTGGGASLGGKLTVTRGGAAISGKLDVTGGGASIGGKLTVTRGGASISGKLNVTSGGAEIRGPLTAREKIVTNNIELATSAPSGRVGMFKMPSNWEIAITSGGGQLEFKKNGTTVFWIDDDGWIGVKKKNGTNKSWS